MARHPAVGPLLTVLLVGRVVVAAILYAIAAQRACNAIALPAVKLPGTALALYDHLRPNCTKAYLPNRLLGRYKTAITILYLIIINFRIVYFLFI